MTTTEADINALFPLPSAAPSRGPVRLPGVTHASSTALVQALEANHVKWHAFFNDRGFHNHISHHLVAIYAMGAGGALIDAAYQAHATYMLPVFESPERIDEKTFWKHLGKREFYTSYLEYFRTVLCEKDITEVLEDYLFSAKANVGGAGVEGEPKMLVRFFSALIHPLIHTGNGLEFGLLGLVAEGLAQTAVHPFHGENLVPASLFQKDASEGAVSRLTALLPSLSLTKQSPKNGRTEGAKPGVHALTILARVLADDKFSAKGLGIPTANEISGFERATDLVGDALASLAAEWVADLDGEGATTEAISKKIEELAWASSVIYGVGGWGARDRSPGKTFNADFFYMHLVTSSLFLPSIIAYLSPRSSVVLLHAFFANTLVWWISQGRAAFPIREFYAATTATPTPPTTGGAGVTPEKGTLTPDDIAPNVWLPIIQTTLTHPDQHISKLQRALLHNATEYGTRGAGHLVGTGLEGAEALDGTLFIRVASLSADRLGWMKEGQAEGSWDRAGFY